MRSAPLVASRLAEWKNIGSFDCVLEGDELSRPIASRGLPFLIVGFKSTVPVETTSLEASPFFIDTECYSTASSARSALLVVSRLAQ